MALGSDAIWRISYRREVYVARSTWMGCGRPQEADEQSVLALTLFLFLTLSAIMGANGILFILNELHYIAER